MKCAKHRDVEAVGMCCCCGRAICADCSQPGASRKLVCSTECERNVSDHDAAITAVLSKMNRNSRLAGIFSILTGVAFIILGFYHIILDPVPVLICLGLVLGAIFLVAGIFYMRNTNRKAPALSNRADDGIVRTADLHHWEQSEKRAEPLASLASSFRIFLWILGIPSVIFSIALLLIVFTAMDRRFENRKAQSTRIIVAGGELPAGTVLTANNIGMKSFRNSDLKTDDWVSPGDAEVLYGHRILSPLREQEPIVWHNTDIVITNWMSRQQI